MCISKECCSGCMACEKVCPKNAIKIRITDRKQFVPEILENKCVNCGLCISVCPHQNIVELKTPIVGYNAWIRKKSALRRSSSGGIATAIYEYGLKNSVLCVGVLFDQNYELTYQFINSFEKIRKTAGSKYVFSNMKEIYEPVLEHLKNKQSIIYIGLPCQVAALKNYCKLKNVALDNLLTVDIVCHGITMPYFFKKHIFSIKCSPRELLNIQFRSKKNPFGITIMDGQNIVYSKSRYDDEYMTLFIKGIYAKTCYKCRFAENRRVGDLTIKDCSSSWENRVNKSIINQSSVLINSEKGKIFWKKIERELVDSYTYPVENIISEDLMLQRPTPIPREYRLFMKLEKKLGYKCAVCLIWGRRNFVQKMEMLKRDIWERK